ncbi:hypothetical protein NL462_27805, partial [Klebsiella pneumoniae]|nr:hypothetical protein [Klebsiella pneumoniae]
GLYRAVGEADRKPKCPQLCDACFTGEYPTALTDYDAKPSPAPITKATGNKAAKPVKQGA